MDCWVELDPASSASLGDALRRTEELRAGVRRRLGNEAGDVTVQLRWKEEAYVTVQLRWKEEAYGGGAFMYAYL